MNFYEAMEKPVVIFGLLSMGFMMGLAVGGVLAQFWGICGVGPI